MCIRDSYRKRDIAGMTASEQLDRINTATRKLVESQYNTYNRSLVPLMAANGIHIIEKYEELTAEQAAYVDRYFEEDVYPVLTPMAVDASRPFPLIRNKTLNIAALLSSKKDEKHKDAVEFATVQVPGVLPVSYTHLDVYKRQPESRVLIPAGTYKITSLFLKSGISVELAKGAELLADTDRSHYAILP